MTHAQSRRRRKRSTSSEARPSQDSRPTQDRRPQPDGGPNEDADAGAPRQATEFSQFGLHDQILRGVEAAGFTEARPIQRKAIGPAQRGSDVLGLAQTGTGKTAAFALPILERLRTKGDGARRGPRALVIAPTRELASQIHAEFERLGRYTRVRSTAIFGGVPQASQVRALKSMPEVVVACPGRLLDLVDQRLVDLSGVEVLVLDEADHMFDMGFLPSLRRILALLPKRRQNLLFSATMPKEIRRLADEILRRPTIIELAHSRPADTIEHALYPCAQNRRLELLEELLSGEDFRSAIVFLRTKHRARKVAKQLGARGHRAVALQGNMSQNQRVRAMEGFRRGDYDVLVATDIAARGIDVENVSHVVNFDVPNTPEAYTHRIGRTGRSEREGKAFTFAAREDDDLVRAIEKHLGAKIQRQSLSGFDVGDVEAPPKPKSARGFGGGRSAGPARPGGTRSGPRGKGRRPGQGSTPGSGSPSGASKAKASKSGSKRTSNTSAKPVTQSASKPRSSGPAFGSGVASAR